MCEGGGVRPRVRWARPLLALFLLLAAGRAFAQEAISIEEPPPESASGDKTSIDKTFEPAKERERITEWIKDYLKNEPAFLRDAKLLVNFRTYYLRQDHFNDTTSEAWAVGGSIGIRTGYLFERLAFGTTAYTSLPLYAPDDRSGTLLLTANQQSYGVVGELYGKLRLTDGLMATAYRQELDTPFINSHDNRMTPNTFEAYTLVGNWSPGGDDGKLTYGGGWVTKIKNRNSDDFVSMSEDAGAAINRGVAVVGASYATKNGSIGLIDYFSNDVINIGYTEAKYSHEFENGLGVLGAVQFTDQHSTGNDLLTGSSFAGNQIGVKAVGSYGGAVATLGYTNTTHGTDLRSPWSSYPGYTSAQVENFNRANEQALMVKASYAFSRVGMPGFTVYALWIHGWDVAPSVGPNEDEYDFDLQWRPGLPKLKGLWLRARFAMVNERGGAHATLDDYRLIVNYDFAAL
ncbi:MAG TPA: OprD family outer membrane porin [Myxococcota bacterium]|nr:OprD family outer membrane porin [Myxococcota bacterium]